MENQVVGWVKRSETQLTNLCLFALWGETYLLMLGFMLQPNLQICSCWVSCFNPTYKSIYNILMVRSLWYNGEIVQWHIILFSQTVSSHPLKILEKELKYAKGKI